VHILILDSLACILSLLYLTSSGTEEDFLHPAFYIPGHRRERLIEVLPTLRYIERTHVTNKSHLLPIQLAMSPNFKHRSRRHGEFQIAVTRMAGRNQCHGRTMQSTILQSICSSGPIELSALGRQTARTLPLMMGMVRFDPSGHRPTPRKRD
jgi:hypothetical protein